MNEQTIKKTKKISGIVLSSVLFAATLVGASFAYADTVQKTPGLDNTFNDYAKIEADVSFKDKNKNIKDLSNSIYKTLDFLGMQDAQIQTIGNNKVVITNPISAYGYKAEKGEYNLNNDIDKHFETTINNSYQYTKEVGTLALSLFLDGTLDIRDIEGDPAFIQKEVQGVNRWVFDGGIENGGSFGVEDSSSGTYETTIRSEQPINFFESANLKHSNGQPSITLQIKSKGSNSDEYINMFKDFDRYLDQNSSTQYVVWFNYSKTYDLINEVDPSGLASSSLFDYVQSSQNLRPLYLTSSTGSIMSSKYSDVVEFKGGFNDKQAKYFVDKINNSSDYKYNNVTFIVVTNLQTKIMMIVLASMVLLFIIIAIFAFVWYFGLIGLIADSILLLNSLIVGLILSSTGVLLTAISIITIGLITLSSAILIFTLLNIYKKGNEDKFHSISKVAFDKFKNFNSNVFVPLITIVLIFYGAGLIVPQIIATTLYLFVIGVSISYIIVNVVLFPLVYIMDLATGFTRVEYNQNWDYVCGNVKSFNLNVKGNENKKLSLIGLIITSVLVAATVITGGLLFSTTDSAVNSNMFGREDYVYQVVVTEDIAKMALNKGFNQEVDNGEIYTSWNFQYAYEATESNKEVVANAFEDAGIKVNRTEVVRFDEIKNYESNYESKKTIVGSYGYLIYSNKEIDANQFKNINDSLSTDVINVIEDAPSTTTSFKMREGSSYVNGTSQKLNNYTYNVLVTKVIYSVLLMSLITWLVLLFVGDSGVALASFITSTLEVMMIFSPIVLLYLPFSISLGFIVVALSGISLINKVLITKKAKASEIDTNKWILSAKENAILPMLFVGFLLFFELFLFGTYRWTSVISILLVTLISGIVMYFNQTFVFAYLASSLSRNKIQRNEERLKKEIEESKNKKPGEIREEYIEGVNM